MYQGDSLGVSFKLDLKSSVKHLFHALEDHQFNEFLFRDNVKMGIF
jgi:hypothetical protein